MTVASNIAGDWEHMGDVIETVTHTDATDSQTYATVKAHRDELSYREISADGLAGLEPTDIVWVVWAETLTVTPAQGDTITDSAGVVWGIMSFSARTIGATVIKYRCICRKQV